MRGGGAAFLNVPAAVVTIDEKGKGLDYARSTNDQIYPVVATADTVASSLRSGRPSPAMSYFKRSAQEYSSYAKI